MVRGQLELEDGRRIPLRLRVIWANAAGAQGNEAPEVGFEVLEAQKDFYDALPMIQLDAG